MGKEIEVQLRSVVIVCWISLEDGDGYSLGRTLEGDGKEDTNAEKENFYWVKCSRGHGCLLRLV